MAHIESGMPEKKKKKKEEKESLPNQELFAKLRTYPMQSKVEENNCFPWFVDLGLCQYLKV